MIPLQGFDFDLLKNPQIRENSVREEIITPILHALEYSASGKNRIVRDPRLKHPFVHIGVTKHPVTIVPDYMLVVDGTPTWIIDAKSPTERVDDPRHIAQVYSYAVHRDVRVDWFAICNGHELALYHMDDLPTPRLRVPLKDLTAQWGRVHYFLRPGASGSRREGFDKDFGILLLGMDLTDPVMTFSGISLDHLQIGRVDADLYRLARTTEFEGRPYAASFDFDSAGFSELLRLLGDINERNLTLVLASHPSFAYVQGELGKVTLVCRLGKPEESPKDQFIPLKVLSVSRDPPPT